MSIDREKTPYPPPLHLALCMARLAGHTHVKVAWCTQCNRYEINGPLGMMSAWGEKIVVEATEKPGNHLVSWHRYDIEPGVLDIGAALVNIGLLEIPHDPT